ncbi:MAG: hypothetical protein RLZZ382_279 [Bacteroidota bacterium]|jgi:hypothetical protein
MKTIKIRKIEFTNFSNKVLCFGELCINNLCIDSYIELSFSSLNRVVGLLNKQLTEVSVYDLIQEEMYDAEKHFSIDLNSYKTLPLSLEELAAQGYPSLKISA